MPNITPEDIATGARDFARSEFGKWYLGELQRRERNLIELGQQTDAHNLTINSIMRAAGVRDALNIIEVNEGVADSNLFKK